ncbi:hypothetical protein [Petralouisia muris]|uniref:hypothetical protein n=1 Tax=Petralouisia muris TaxID=3032872 RepID=UPI0014424B9A|nr:hypothetical protein [Petralouisia muris]
MIALTMAMGSQPQAVTMSFQREYAEPYEWLLKEFSDWVFTFVSAFLYYQDKDMHDDMQKDLYRQGMAAFGGIAPFIHEFLSTISPSSSTGRTIFSWTFRTGTRL